ncbi:hypothetical protein Acr_20g0003390 [Actinidia rufa]|uniref:Uncharacterized protein n=1 Tax=Actinidia rufa TaxID=165716 RepID=A0A7J0GCP6_9ERIC|nr:hypothetical protein Acr_20g0003390 [Actinidia rufa]
MLVNEIDGAGVAGGGGSKAGATGGAAKMLVVGGDVAGGDALLSLTRNADLYGITAGGRTVVRSGSPQRRLDRVERLGERVELESNGEKVGELSQLGDGDFTGEFVVGEVEAEQAEEVGDSGREFSGEVVVGEVEVLEVGPGGEVVGGGEAVLVEAEVGEASQGLG